MKNVENKLKYDYVWITRMLSEDFAEMEPFVFKKRIKEADNEHLKFLLKSLQLREEFSECLTDRVVISTDILTMKI